MPIGIRFEAKEEEQIIEEKGEPAVSFITKSRYEK